MQGCSTIQACVEAKLPVEDLPQKLENFLVGIDNGKVIGVAGLEIYGEFGLLRSVAVSPARRGEGIAGDLIARLEQTAATRGLKALFLLTETAADYFVKKGFQITGRPNLPDPVKASSEFSHVCPVSAIAMKKPIL